MIWKNVIGEYEVSRYGNVRSNHFGKTRMLKQIRKVENRREYKGRGYYQTVHLYVDGKRTDVPVHVLVATAFIPNPDNKPTVNHKDGNKEHNWVDNLEWATYAENNQHAVATGLK